MGDTYSIRRSTRRITCSQAGCEGCNTVHRKVVGQPRYYVGKQRVTEEAWKAAMAEDANLRLGV